MHDAHHRYFILNKPYNMVSQFVSTHQVPLLGDLAFEFPPGTHAIGRLDSHTEGLLLLTTNKKITRLLFEGKTPHKRTYLVQVNNELSEKNLQLLRNGLLIKTGPHENYLTTPCEAAIVADPEKLYPFSSPVIVYPPYTWVSITLTEGKYHQVRKMLGAVRHRCKRLIRVAIENITLNDLSPGSVRELEEQDFFSLLDLRDDQSPLEIVP